MRLFQAALLVLISLWPAAGRAETFDNPRALVEAIYAPYLRGARHTDLSQFYSAALKQLFAQRLEADLADPATAASADAPATVFNPFVDADNYLLFDLFIGEPVINGDRAMVSVKFHNFDHPSLLSLSLLKEADGWKVDDVASMGIDQHWLLSWLLIFDPLGL